MKRPPRIGFRREALAVLPLATVLLAALAAWAAFAHRSTLDAWVDERQERVESLARRLAFEAAAGMPLEDLRRRSEGAVGLALFDSAGRRLQAFGEPVSAPPGGAADAGSETPRDGRLRAWAEAGGGTIVVSWPASLLEAQRRSQRLTFLSVLSLATAVILLVALFMRRLLSPYEQLLAGARGAGLLPTGPGADDEVAELLGAFERAVAERRDATATALPFASSAVADAAPGDLEKTLQQTLLPSLEAGLILLDREGRVLSGNGDAWRLLGVESERGLPTPTARGERPWAEVFRAFPGIADTLRRLFDGDSGPRRATEFEVRGEVAATPRFLGLSLLPLRPREGAPADAAPRGYALLIADRTERRHAEDERRLAENLRRLGETAAGVAHEMRNGLATARGYLALIERRTDRELDRQDLSEVRRELEGLGRVVTDFLDFARPERARAERVAPVALAERAVTDPDLPPPAPRCEVGADLPDLLVDPYLVERALRNLLRNAATAQTAAGSREPPLLRAHEVGGGVEFVVEDRGLGIDPSVRDRLFEPFQSGRPGGVGLGLALSRRIALLHGGRLSIEDRAGGGVSARLWLPAPGGEA